MLFAMLGKPERSEHCNTATFKQTYWLKIRVS